MSNQRQNQTIADRKVAQYNTRQVQRVAAPKQAVQQGKPRTINSGKKKNNKAKEIVKKICGLLAFLVVVSAVKEYPYAPKGTVTQIASKNAAHNYMDDVFASDETIEIINPISGETEVWQLEDAVDKLENLIEANKAIKDLKLDETDYVALSDEEIAELLVEFEEKSHYIEPFIAQYKHAKNDIEKARAARNLIFLKGYLGGDWVTVNGINVSRALLNKVVQTGTIDAYGTFEPLEYSVASVSGDKLDFKGYITDPISGKEDSVFFTPVLAGEYAKASYLAKEANELSGVYMSPDEIEEFSGKAINTSKRCLSNEIKTLGPITYTKTLK